MQSEGTGQGRGVLGREVEYRWWWVAREEVIEWQILALEGVQEAETEIFETAERNERNKMW